MTARAIGSAMLSAACLTVIPATALVVVAPDGSGDYPALQAAIDAHPSGETVELTDGVFTGAGNRDLDFMLYWTGELRSRSGDPQTCYLDLEGHTLGQGEGFQDITFRGLGIRNGSEGYRTGMYGSAIFLNCEFENTAWVGRVNESGIRMEDCTVTGGTETLVSGSGGAGFYRCHLHANGEIADCNSATLIDCTIEGNTATTALVTVWTSMYYGGCGLEECSNCIFADNQAPFVIGGAGIRCTGCTFVGNTGGAIEWAYWGSEPCQDLILTGCTFVAGGSTEGAQIVTDAWEDPWDVEVRIDNCLIAFNEGAAAQVSNAFSVPEIGCSDFWSNTGGDWTGLIADQLGVNGNIAQDPRLCSLAERDLHLRADSPCAPFSPPNPECDLIGAWPVGCSSSTPEPPSSTTARALAPPRPNPFGRATWVALIGSAAGPEGAAVVIHDATGRVVRRLEVPAVDALGGVWWDGRSDEGAALPSGVYVCRLRGAAKPSQRLVLVR